ncbi:MAG: hypothetical protein ACOX4C_00900 [Bacillota bacterium]
MEHESDVALVVYDTGIRRELVESAYNLRRAELEKGAEMIVDVLNRLTPRRSGTWAPPIWRR